MIDPSISTGLASALESVINAALNYDPGTRAKLKSLRGCLFQFECRSPELNLFFFIDEQNSNIIVSSYTERSVTTKVAGSFVDVLIFFVSSDNSVSSLAGSGLSVMGNSAKLANLQSLIHQLDIDWEQALIDFTSPLGESANVTSHQFASSLKTFFNWLRKGKNNLRNNLGDYLREELRAIPSKPELTEFYEGVAHLRADAERLRLRIDTLIQTTSTNRE